MAHSAQARKQPDISLPSESTRAGLPLESQTIAEAYHRRVELSPEDRCCLFKKGEQYQPILWKEVHHDVLGLVQALDRLGVKKGDRLAIISHTRPEWNTTDLAILSMGAITVPIYPSNLPDEVAYVLEDSGTKLVFAENKTLCDKLGEAFKVNGKSLPIVCFDGDTPSTDEVEVVPYEQFKHLEMEAEAQTLFEKLVSAVTPDDYASIVYTSGTTGQPKGVLLSHLNFASGLRLGSKILNLTNKDITMTFLPFSHVLGRYESLFAVFTGITLGYAQDINSIPQNLVELKPTLMFSVPRIFEKTYAKIMAQVESAPPSKKKLFEWAVSIGKQTARLRNKKQPIPLLLILKERVADQLVFNKIKAKMGGRMRFSISGGAPLDQDLCEFFWGCGIPILVGYGLTETVAPISVNRPEAYHFGTVGHLFDECEVKIDTDGEILLKGPVVFKGYWNQEQATQEAFAEGGWFRSGDIGEIEEGGFLKITDRKKEIIVTAGGKNVAPQKIENLMKNIPWISNCMIYGDREKFLVALVTLTKNEVLKYAQSKALDTSNYEKLLQQKEIHDTVHAEMEKMNKQLPSFETIKRFSILPHDFSIETGELTPSLKIKRKVIIGKYGSLIKELFK